MRNAPLFFVLLALLLLPACGSEIMTWLPPVPTTAPPAPAATRTPAESTISLAEYPALPEGLVEAQVVEVVDGDTMDVRVGQRVVRLRLIGINTPETVDPRRPVQCFGREASEQAKARLNGQRVFLEDDPTQGDVDQYGRLLRYLWLPSGELYNLDVIAQGYANEYTYDVPYKYQGIFQDAEDEAREQQRGLWSAETCGGDTARPAGSTATPPPTACDPAYPDVCIPSPPPDLDCRDIPHRRFRVLPPDPHRFDGGNDGVGCEG